MEPLPWEGIFNATEEGDSCLSVDPIFQAIRGDEDCLTLSVYTPKVIFLNGHIERPQEKKIRKVREDPCRNKTFQLILAKAQFLPEDA